MPEKYRVAIFGRSGKGNYGHSIDTDWLQLSNCEVVAVCDENRQGREAAARRLYTKTMYTDYRQMLDETKPDIVAICPRWIDMHAEVAIAAAERGIHILTEKPFCRTPAEADAIIAACEMRHIRLAIAHMTHYSPILATVRKLIRDGAIGNVLELRARGKEDHRGGGEDLWVLGSHLLDLILALGYTPEWVFGDLLQDGRPVTKDDVREGPEGLGPLAGNQLRAVYGLKGGITATFQSYQNQGHSPGRYALQIYGSEGIMEISEGALAPTYILQDPTWCPARSGAQWKRVSTAGIDRPETLKDARYDFRNVMTIEDLLSAIENQRDPLCSMYEGRKVVEMTTGVFESYRIGGRVSFPRSVRDNPLVRLS